MVAATLWQASINISTYCNKFTESNVQKKCSMVMVLEIVMSLV